jgi:hypothetical protein
MQIIRTNGAAHCDASGHSGSRAMRASTAFELKVTTVIGMVIDDASDKVRSTYWCS